MACRGRRRSGILDAVETTPAIQDYLGAIYDLTGGDKPVIGARLARHMHVSAPSITEALRRMQREGYIRLAGKKEIRLTSKGLASPRPWRAATGCSSAGSPTCSGWTGRAPTTRRTASSTRSRRWWRSGSPSMLGMPSTCPHGNPIPGMPAPEAHNPIPLSQAQAGQELTVDRITEEAEADRQLLHFLWESGVRPGARLTIKEVAPYAGTISVLLDGRTVTMGLVASSKIWVYDPEDPEHAPPRGPGGTRSWRSPRRERPAPRAPRKARAAAARWRSRASTPSRTASSASRGAASSSASARASASRSP